MSEWTFCKFVTCQNGLLQNCHMSEWTFAELSHVRMEFCKIFISQNGLLQNFHLSEWTDFLQR